MPAPTPLAFGLGLSCLLSAQTPGAKFTESFFKGDRKAVLQACADEARAIKPKDAKWLAEYGRAYLAALDKPKAEAAFKEALAKEPKDGEVHRLIGNAWLKHGFKQQALEAYGLILSLDAKNEDALVAAALDLAENAVDAAAALRLDRLTDAFLLPGAFAARAKWSAVLISLVASAAEALKRWAEPRE